MVAGRDEVEPSDDFVNECGEGDNGSGGLLVRD